MNIVRNIPFFFIILMLSSLSLAQDLSAKYPVISYFQVTNGLDVPQFEKGYTDFALADINMDGHLDLLSVGDHGSPFFNSDQHGIMVWFGDGQGNFSLHMEGNFGYGGIAVGDVNNDGFQDVGYGIHHNYSGTSFGDQLIEVVLGDGTGMNWTVWDEGLATNGETWGMFGTAFSDFNNDGYLDLVSTAFGCCAGIHVYINQTDGSWEQSYGFTGGNSGLIVRAIDIDGDGHMDFVANHQNGTAYFGDGTGNFIIIDNGLPMGTSRSGIDVSYWPGHEGAGISYINSSGGVVVYRWDNNSTTWTDLSGNLPQSGPYQMSQLHDMNSDGHVDVLAYGNKTFQLWLGDGTGNWTPDASFNINANPGYARSVRTGGDFDNNGYPDLVILNQELSGGFIQFDQSRLYVYFEGSVADSLWIKPVYPSGGENFYAGSVRFIEWISSVPGNIPSEVKIELSAHGPDGPWIMLGDNLPNNGKHQWIVPDYGSESCHLKLTVSTANGSDQQVIQVPFTIFGTPVDVHDLPGNRNAYLSIFPNPGKNVVSINSSQKINQIVFFDAMGRKILEIKEPDRVINLGHLPEGIHFYRVIFDNGMQTGGIWLKID